MNAPTRRVVLVCGPPGSGKTTYARTTGLDVYDRDDDQWRTRDFLLALTLIGADPHAQACVIRSGATCESRRVASVLIRPTDVRIFTTPLEECIRRIAARRRTHPPVRSQMAAARDWWHRYDADKRTAPLMGVRTRQW